MFHSPRFALVLAIGLFSLVARPPEALATSSLRFFGNGVGAPGLDRVEISLDQPHRPVDVGGDFTIEFWLKALPGENEVASCDLGRDNWIFGNIVLDRDVFFGGDYGDWGLSLGGGRIMFGVSLGTAGNGLCGATNVADSRWHHVAVTRRSSDGRVRLWVDGSLDAEMTGPAGDVSYRDGRPTNFEKDPFLVLGAEKHDAGGSYPSYSGWLDELRISSVERYATAFVAPVQPFGSDVSTAAVYHLDEGAGDLVADSSDAAGGPSHGSRKYGGTPAGPLWSDDIPFVDGIFADGFESGNLSSWSSTQGS